VHLKTYIRGTPLRVECIMGGTPINRQIRNLSRGADILVATPGRLIDLIEREAVILDKTTFLVLDEADQMLDLGFIHTLRRIAQLVGTPRQTMLFSATMPRNIEALTHAFLTDPVRVETATPGRAADKIAQSVHFIEKNGKALLLKKCLSERTNDLSLVFCRTKHGAEKLMKQLVAAGFSAASIHGNKSQGQRERALKGFRNGNTRILVATDVAARGIDISGVTHVYNFDLPEVAENYVHRIGRTARAGANGLSVAFCSPEEIGLLRAVEKVMAMKIEVASGEAPPDSRARKPARRGNSGGRGRPFGRGRSSDDAGRTAKKWKGRKGSSTQGENTGDEKRVTTHKPGGFKHRGQGSDVAPAGERVVRKARFEKSDDQNSNQPGGRKKSHHRGQGKPAGAGKRHGQQGPGQQGQGRPQAGGNGSEVRSKPANTNSKKRRKSNAKRSAA
ncbi:MAG: DEAD/DEAH box helicase, partial [Alphaproteobacteria bacterium]|nr:DEAD/DEAH box helicase [Alphaproteobacteria bacterium]